MFRKLCVAAIAVGVLCVPALQPVATLSATAGSTLTASATVLTGCTINPSTLSFGSYEPMAATAATATATVAFACVKGTAYTVTSDFGANATHAVGTSRAMLGATGNYLSYEIYTNTARTTVFNTTNTITGTSAGKASTTFTLYGSIPAAQDVPTGSYSDVDNLTISF